MTAPFELAKQTIWRLRPFRFHPYLAKEGVSLIANAAGRKAAFPSTADHPPFRRAFGRSKRT